MNDTDVCSNSTWRGEKPAVPVIKIVHDVVIITLLVSIMFAMGCLITIKEVRSYLRTY